MFLVIIGSYDHELSTLRKANRSDKTNKINSFVNKLRNSRVRGHINEDVKNGDNENHDPIYYLNANTYSKFNSNKKMPLNQERLNYVIQNQSMDKSDRINTSNSSHSATRLELEMQKKVKTILKKNIISRYRRSPYLKSFDKL